MRAIEVVLPYYTYEDYEKWEGRWELINGLPYAMSPLPSIKHQSIASKLLHVFMSQMEACEGRLAIQPVDYLVKNDTVLQPDMLVICGDTKEKYLDFPPALVVEILSPSTALKDRHTKFAIYQSQRIPYFIIISPKTEEAEVYEYIGEEYCLAKKGKDFSRRFNFGDCEATIDFSNIW